MSLQDQIIETRKKIHQTVLTLTDKLILENQYEIMISLIQIEDELSRIKKQSSGKLGPG